MNPYGRFIDFADFALVISAGDWSVIETNRYCTQLISIGNLAHISSSSTSGRNLIVSMGNDSYIAASGFMDCVVSTGSNSVVVNTGPYGRVKASTGTFVTLAEYKESHYESRIVWEYPLCTKTEYVDGERIKADTLYTLKNGEFTEVAEE